MTETFFLERNRRTLALRLGKLLGEGAVGKVYAVDGAPDQAVKLYHDVKEAAAIEPKVAMMLANPPDLPAIDRDGHAYPQIAWPSARVIDGQGRFRGFLMPTIDLKHSTSLVNLLQKSSRRAEKLSDYYGYRVMVAYNLASMFAELHRAGHHMIDMKPANLRIYPETAWIAVVDTDGFSIAGPSGRIPAGQVSDDYIAPESWQRSARDLGEAQDLFALAVIVFQLLNNGVHPFSGRAADEGQPLPTDIQTRILQGLYAYGGEPHDRVKPAAMSIHRTFRRDTRQLFDQAFLPGHRRPTAEQWRAHLAKLIELLTPCQANPAEHAHFGSGCGFCLHEAQMAAMVAEAKTRPRPVPARAPLAVPTRPRPPGSPHRPAAASGRALVPARKRRGTRASQRLKKRVFTAIGAGMVLGVLMIIGLIAEQLTEGLMSPSAVAGSGRDAISAGIPQMQTFPMPIRYRLIPDRTGHGDALRLGPGTGFATSDPVRPNERVTGLAESRDADGRHWIWVKRADGGSGYLPGDRLTQVPDLFDDDDSAGSTAAPAQIDRTTRIANPLPASDLTVVPEPDPQTAIDNAVQ